jgi:predicted  nucleic acid-binding Zn-ribbon protein
MATFEDAAEDLVVKLRGLDSEIEESEHALEDLRGRVEDVGNDVEQEWTAFSEALTSFLEKVDEEQTLLHQLVQDSLQELNATGNALGEQGAEARTEIAEGDAQLDELGQHATGLEPGVESLVAEAGEAPARGLAARAEELQQELARLVEEARDFLRDEVVPGIEQAATDIHERCQALRDTMAGEAVTALQAAFDDWESKVDDLEDYVSSQGFVASHAHALAVVEYALDECRTASEAHLDRLGDVLDAVRSPLHDLSEEVQRTSRALSDTAGTLVSELDEALTTARNTAAAFDSVRNLLAAYSFVTV